MRSAALIAVCLLVQDDNRDRPTGAAAKCGSEIAWKTSVDEAAPEAKKAGRLILWYVPTVQGTPMDRKSVVDNYAMMGPWMMRDVVDLVSRKFVPLRMAGRGDLAKQCGVSRLEFIEPGFVFLTPDLKLVHKVDRVSTWNEDWFADLLRGVLRKAETYDKPSAATLAAKKGPDKDAYALELMKDGDLDGALKAATSPLRKAQILRRLRKGAEAAESLKAAAEAATSDAEKADVACESGILALKEGRNADAVAAFDGVKTGARAAEAAYLKGAALFLINKDGEGVAEWKKAAGDAASPWAWKAEAELQHLGPFYRCFEELAWLPEQGKDLPATSTLSKKAKDVDFVTKRCVALLLKTQRADGVWNDSNYDYGGKASLPNVYMAGTALACMALLAWKDVDPKGVQAALDRAWPFLNDEKNIADEPMEIIWAHAYRVQYLVRLAAADPSKKADCLKKINEIVGFIGKLQKRTGIWQHEYDAPFTTATVLVSLWEAKQAGAAVPDEVVKKGAGALAECRDAKGIFSYNYPGRGSSVQFGAGRMPLCEFALLVNGRSSEAAVKASIEASFEHHALIEKIRKYDDHADQFRNGGFFFWYDMVGRAEAAKKIKDGAKLLERQRDLALSITEIDGCFVDSHELGKSYGTAMGLLTLKLCEKK